MDKKLERESKVNKKVTKQEEEKLLRDYRIKRGLYYTRIILSLIVIILEVMALFKIISVIWGLLVFAINMIIKYFFTKKWLILNNYFVIIDMKIKK